MDRQFRVGITRDFLAPDGKMPFADLGFDLLESARGVAYELFPEHRREVGPDQIAGYDAIVSLAPAYTRETFAGADRLAVIARFGVGYDMIDLAAATEAGVAVAITPEGVRRPVASSVVTFILALAHRMFDRDRLVRSGQTRGQMQMVGTGLSGRTLGLVGLGNIGRDIIRLIRPFGMVHIAHDPYASPTQAAELGVELVSLDDLLSRSDFVSINCPLNAETRGLINERELRLMKSTAFFINTARGPIVDQAALTRALQERRIAGAALDVFEVEPLPASDPLVALDNVILAQHSICITDEVLRGNGTGACQAALSVARGEAPAHVVNREVLGNPRWLHKLAAPRG
jgi:D-3-phosphoglycerate dehydrogenase